MEVSIRPRHSHSNSFGNDAEKDTAGCRALNRKYIVIGGEKNFEGTVTDLQMGGYLLIRDFRQRINKKGVPYGWPISVYTTPEAL